MQFKELIRAYQEGGDLSIVKCIMDDVETIDFMENPTRKYIASETRNVSVELSEPRQYIAYRIKAIREMAVKHAWYVRQPLKYSYPELNRYLSIMAIDLNIDIPFEPVEFDRYLYTYEINAELMAWLRKEENTIEERFIDGGFGHDYKWYLHVLTLIEKTEVEAVKEEARIRTEVMEDMEKALKHVLKYVDLERSEQEIVKYVNASLMTRYYGEQSKRNGFRRVRRGGDDWMIKPQFASPIASILGMDVPPSKLAKSLTERQSEFLRKLTDKAEEDIRENRNEGYSVTREGRFIMKGAYAAQVSGLSYEVAKRRLTRIKNKFRNFRL
ncbi:hypothetical protein B4V02_09085 [Paenibacillus kribbensis]|uniref:Uncharacterized protein n=1 Tax=Paenibacillus kribbensis TaxID=172713 RepID=A0A222WLD3_9BACL|nr:hypothetical protein [Paenibacillus kribbensis]ASR46822.1 hypothetical protein B4V02_09085 [Paenibacillus kribbensis]